MMMKRERVQKKDSCCPSVKPANAESIFAPRPFAPPVQELEAPAAGPGIGFNFADISILPREMVQPKLVLGPVGDKYEQEADQVARQVVDTISSSDRDSVQRQEDLEEEDELDLEELEKDEDLRRKVDGLAPAGGADVGPDLESAIHRARSGGVPLSDGVRQPMERAFGADFGGVRVHADGEADRLNRSLQARAFTTGRDIFLRQGEYRPRSSEGQRLLAHELTHVVQQNGSRFQQNQSHATGRVIQRMAYIVGNITYTTGPFRYGAETSDRERVTSVTMKGRNQKNDAEPENPISFRLAGGSDYDDLAGYHRGHVAARQFGGTQYTYNVVPMLPNFNTGVWKNEEDVIGKELTAGETVTVQPNYNNTPSDDARVPNSLTVTSTRGYTHIVPHAVDERLATTDEEMRGLRTVGSDAKSVTHAANVLSDAAIHRRIPSYYELSPYKILDVAWLSGGGPGSPEPRKEVQTWQVDWLIRYNKRINGGTIVSDAWVPGGRELYEQLYEAGRNDRPEVDHIIPMSRGGANLFTNFRLVSFELNNSIERVVPYEQKSVKWKS